GDDEGGDARIGDPEPLPSSDGDTNQQAEQDREVRVPTPGDDERSGTGAHEGHHRTNGQVDVTAGKNTHEHAYGEDHHVGVLEYEVGHIHGLEQRAIGHNLKGYDNGQQRKQDHVLPQVIAQRCPETTHAPISPLLCCMMQFIIPSWVASAWGNSAMMRPLSMT